MAGSTSATLIVISIACVYISPAMSNTVKTPQCPTMPNVPNSSGYKCVNKGQVQSGSYPYQTACRNQCATGYLPRPGTSQFVICRLNPARTGGKWSGRALVCEPQTCTNLPEVLHGQYNLPVCSNAASDRVFGTVCSLQCNHGYLLSEDVKWTCQSDGQWSNFAKTVFCKDMREPEFLQCPQNIAVDNEDKQGYALVQLKPLEAFDNDASGGIKQTMKLKLYGSSTGIEYPCDKVICGQKSFKLLIGTSTVNFTASDRSGNSANCIFQVTVRDIEPPTIVQCDGPEKDEKGFIFTDNDDADIQWKTPKFADNSGQQLETYSTGSPGTYRVGRTWTITYTAKDKAGNTAKCEFSFKLSGIKCPQLHLPANGAMVCDKLAFGVYCVPQCQKGLTRLLPDEIARIPVDYFCSVKGKWQPHDTVGDCSLRTPVTPDTIARYEFTWFEGNCNDEQTKQSIIQNTLDALDDGGPSFIGVGFKDSQDGKLSKGDFEVFCGPLNMGNLTCPIGQFYNDWVCNNCPANQTTLSPGSTSVNQCVCKRGFHNPLTKSIKPPCTAQTCTNLPEVLNGQYNLAQCSNVDSDRVFGKVCRVQCNHGYLVTEDVKWTCQSDGQWSNYAKTVFCKDVREPEFLQCPQQIYVDNEAKQGYALVQLKPLDAFDNDASGAIKQTMNLKLYGSNTGVEYPCDKDICGQKSFKLLIGTSTLNFTASDRSGNSANCIFHFTVRDTEPPTVVQCDGPVKDEKGFIFTDKDEADIQWKTPKFADNSGQELEMFSTGSPGTYRAGRTWTITYTAKDKAGNTAKCEFSFKLSGIKCPQLHLPANGAMVCDKLAFGVYCVPQCQKGLTRLFPDEIARIPADYFCSVKGKWLPHDTVGDCSLRTAVTPVTKAQYGFTWFEGNCNDEQTKQSIIQNTLDALEAGGPSFIGVGFKDIQDRKLSKGDFEVFCGPLNMGYTELPLPPSTSHTSVRHGQIRLVIPALNDSDSLGAVYYRISCSTDSSFSQSYNCHDELIPAGTTEVILDGLNITTPLYASVRVVRIFNGYEYGEDQKQTTFPFCPERKKLIESDVGISITEHVSNTASVKLVLASNNPDSCVQSVSIHHNGTEAFSGNSLQTSLLFTVTQSQSHIYRFTMSLTLIDGHEMMYWEGEADLTSPPPTTTQKLNQGTSLQNDGTLKSQVPTTTIALSATLGIVVLAFSLGILLIWRRVIRREASSSTPMPTNNQPNHNATDGNNHSYETLAGGGMNDHTYEKPEVSQANYQNQNHYEDVAVSNDDQEYVAMS